MRAYLAIAACRRAANGKTTARPPSGVMTWRHLKVR
jgi:hypothetical protein